MITTTGHHAWFHVPALSLSANSQDILAYGISVCVFCTATKNIYSYNCSDSNDNGN